jgi:hypothetical protein
MKNTIRVRKNSASKSTASQVQTAATKPNLGPAFQLPNDASHACCLAVVNRDEQALASKVPLSETEFAELWETGVKKLMRLPAKDTADMTPAHYLARCLRQSLQLPALRNELESAKMQNLALHHLISDAMSHQDREGSGYGEEIKAGIVSLIHETTERIEKVYNTLDKIVSGEKAGEAKAVAS